MALSTTKEKYLYWGISFISITVILFVIYFNLGGFNDVKAGKSSGSKHSIAGKWVIGENVRKKESEVFYTLKQQVELGELQGILCMVDFKNDTLQGNEVAHFFGVILENEVSALPAEFDIIELNAETTYKASLTMHPIVMPNTETVEKQLQDIAASYGDKLRPLTIEMFFEDNSIMVEMLAY
ncbi:hypothetical protein [Reichenbachiella versicolor]|uniref:hypothetical protein n=1 Tax=Reichenbachiella versicolor TaxID=1821036 RepID=UPI000D6E9A7A|nr:hypothetical protein [Reichenbachiella versicolor]